MNRVLAGVFAAALFTGVTMGFAQAADPAPVTAPNRIKMNFQNVEIPVLAKFISEITGKNFILDESVRGKVSIISPTDVTPDQAYSMFQSVLQIKGFTTVPAGKAIKIVPSRNVRSSATLADAAQIEEGGDEYVTRMVKLRNVDVSAIVGVLQPMVSSDGLIAAFPSDNTLIITDSAYNVDRLLKIVGSLDAQGVQQNIAVIPLKHAFAGDLAPKIEDIMGARGSTAQSSAVSSAQGRAIPAQRSRSGSTAPASQGPQGTFKVVADERINSLVVLAAPLQMRQIQEIIKQLDIDPPRVSTRIHVYRLQNAQAVEMVAVLDGLLKGGGGPTNLSPRTGRFSLGRGSALGNYSGGYSSGFGGGSSGYGGGGGFGGGGFGGGGGGYGGGGGGGGIGGPGNFSPRMTSGSRGGSDGGGSGSAATSTGSTGGPSSEFSDAVTVTADPATNSLIVSAAPQDWALIKSVVQQLDIARVQVFVQAVIVEVSTARARDIGVSFMANTSISGSVLGLGNLDFGQLQRSLGNPLGLTGLGIGLASGSTCSVPVPGASGSTSGASTIKVPCDVALMTALESDRDTNILSAPTLLTADNTEAMIIIGQNVPFVGSSAANAGLPGQIFNSVERQNVGITLDIVPQVSEGDYVRMDLYQEVSSLVGTTINNPLGPTTTIRSASTTVLVQNHRTAVIGGLLASQDEKQRQGVPFISNLPVIGNLFSDDAKNRTKNNLLVFLTPHVIRNPRDLRSLALDERQKFLNNMGNKALHEMPATQLREVYKPSFSVPVPPSAGMTGPYGGPDPYAPEPEAPVGGTTSPTPFNTEEIGPTSKRSTTPAGAAAAPAGAKAPAAATVPAASTAPAASTSAVAVAASADVSPSAGIDAAKAALKAAP
jgi:general secretion pathway protein D